MPINSHLLKRIKNNDSTLQTITLSSRKKLNHDDLLHLIQALKTNTTIIFLDVTLNKLDGKAAKVLAPLNSTITTLNINSNQIGDIGAECLALNTTLTKLHINANQIGSAGAEALALSTSIIGLDAWHNEMRDAGAEALARNTTITDLNLAFNQIGPAGAQALARNTTLTNLDLRFNHIGPAGAEALARNTTLNRLYLVCNRIGNSGAEAFTCNTTLTELDISFNDITISNKITKAFMANTTLTTLNIKHNKISDEDREQLNQAIALNRSQMIQRRDQFIQVLILLAHGKIDNESEGESLWIKLPKELKLHIIGLINFSVIGTFGKSAQQTMACAKFIFDNSLAMKEALATSLSTRQDFKIFEKMDLGVAENRFRFFPPNPNTKSHRTASEQDESMESPHKIQKTR